MNTLSHIISAILSISSFFGFANVPPEAPPITPLPGLEQTISSSTNPLLNLVNSVGQSSTSTAKSKQKLPTLSINAPIYTLIHLSNAVAPTSTPPRNNHATIATLPAPLPIISQPTIPHPAPVVPPPTPIQSTPTSATNNDKGSRATVNIYCTVQNGNLVTIVTGSGVFIDPRGVIMTNAHVADRILINDYLNNSNAGCIIRGGSPARALYKVSLIYIAPAWIQAHGHEVAQNIESQETGEGDYALLEVTGTYGTTLLPSSFPAVSIDASVNSLYPNASVLAVGYPAGNLTGATVVNNLILQSVPIDIKAVYSFGGGSSKDLIRTNSTPLAVKGSSGGGIFSAAGELIGLIATTIPGSSSNMQDLQALSLSYINNDLKRNTGRDLSVFLSRDLPSLIQDFKENMAPTLMSFIR